MQSERIFLGLLVLLSACFYGGNCYSNGAPRERCTNMQPGHGTSSNSVSPYTIDVGGVSTYTNGTPITVTLAGGQFKGFLLQVRQVGSEKPIGSFSNQPSGTQLRTCSASGDAVTHSSSALKSSVAATWTPPNTDSGNIQVVVTFLQEYNTNFLRQTSVTLSFSAQAEQVTGWTQAPAVTSNVTAPDHGDDGHTHATGNRDSNGASAVLCNVVLFIPLVITLMANWKMDIFIR